MRLLRSRSRSQRRFKISVNVCPGDVFWLTEHFVTKFSMVMHHHEPECHAEIILFLFFAVFKVKSQRGPIWSKYDFLLYFLNCWFLSNQTWSDDTSSWVRVSCENQPWCNPLRLTGLKAPSNSCEKDWITAFRVKVTAEGQNVNVCPDDTF